METHPCSNELLSCLYRSALNTRQEILHFVQHHNSDILHIAQTTLYTTNKYHLHLAKAEKRQDFVGVWWWCRWGAAEKEMKSAAVRRVSIFIVMWHRGRSFLLDPFVSLMSIQTWLRTCVCRRRLVGLELRPRLGPPHWWRWLWPWSSAGTGGPGQGAGCHSPAYPSQNVSWSPGAPMGQPHDSVPLPVDLWNRRDKKRAPLDKLAFVFVLFWCSKHFLCVDLI